MKPETLSFLFTIGSPGPTTVPGISEALKEHLLKVQVNE